MSPISNTGGGGSGTIPVSFGTAAARPPAAAGNANTIWYATDTGEVTFSDGAAWHSITQISPLLVSGSGINLGAGTSNPVSWGAGGPAIRSPGGGQLQVINSFLAITGAGNGLRVAEGANAKQGTYGPLVAGTLLVANTSVTATSRIQVTRAPGGTNPGAHMVSAQAVGASFTVTSTNAADTGGGVFEIFEPG